MSANFTRSDFPCYDDDCVSEVEDGTFEYTEETEGGYIMCIVHKPRGFFLTPTLFHSLYLGRFKIMFNVINCGSSKNLLATSGVTFQ